MSDWFAANTSSFDDGDSAVVAVMCDVADARAESKRFAEATVAKLH